MLDLSFNQQLTLTLIDKAVIGGLLAFAVFGFNRLLESFKAAQNRQLEQFRIEQSRNLELLRAEQTRALERFKFQLVSEGEFARNVRVAVGDLSRRLAAGSHSIMWLSWAACRAPETVLKEQLDAYDGEMHLILSDMVGARAVLAALDLDLHRQFTPLVNELYRMDAHAGEAKVAYTRAPAKALAALCALNQQTVAFDEKLIQTIAGIEKFQPPPVAAHSAAGAAESSPIPPLS